MVKISRGVRRAQEIADAKRRNKLVSTGKAKEEPPAQPPPPPPYDASGDLIKFYGWHFDAIGNNAELRKLMDYFHRNGAIYYASRSFAFKNAFVLEPRYLGPRCYEDYELRERRFVPCMMVFSIYHTIMCAQFSGVERVIAKAKEDLKSEVKLDKLEEFVSMWKASVEEFQREIKRINVETATASAFVSNLTEIEKELLKQELETLSASVEPDETRMSILKSRMRTADIKCGHICLGIFEANFRKWVNTFELQRAKNESLSNLIKSLATKQDDAVIVTLLKYTNMNTMTQKVGGTLHMKYECFQTHSFTSEVFMTFSKEGIDPGSLEIQQEYERAEEEMKTACEKLIAANQPLTPQPLPVDQVPENLPAVDLSYYEYDDPPAGASS